MNLNPLPTLDAQAPTSGHENTNIPEAHETASVSHAVPGMAPANSEPSPSERLYEAYRLWAFTGR